MQHVRHFWIPILLGLAGFSLGVHPEIAIVFLLIAGVKVFFRNQIAFIRRLQNPRGLHVVLVLFCLLRIILAWRTTNLWYSVLECLAAAVMLLIGVWLNQQKAHLNVFVISIFLGLVSIIGIHIVPRLVFAFQGGSLEWESDSTLVQEIKIDDTIRFQAVSPNAYVLHDIVMLGSGQIRYQVEVRAKQPFQTSIGFIQSSLKNGRRDRPCIVTTNWSWCSVEAKLASRDWAQLGLGGFGTWNLNSPILETRNAKLVVLEPPNIVEVLTDSSRVSGFSFNFNAFAAQITIAGIIALNFTRYALWMSVLTVMSLFGIALSGSRGAMAAFTLGVFTLVIARTRYYKNLLWILPIIFIGAIFLQANSIDMSVVTPTATQSNLRSLNITDQNTVQGRLEIWRLATKAWLENPRTVFLGTGDLTSAMKVKFDARSSSYGLSKDSLTHAHNLWIQTAGESGLVGLLAMLILWMWIVRKAWRSRDAGALALLAAIFVINSVDYLFFYAPVHLAFWMAAAGFKNPDSQPQLGVRPQKG